MGDRGQVWIHEDNHDIWLYTHWNAYQLEEKVKKSLSYNRRWNDAEYLTRIIFQEMIRDHFDPFTGYGIGNSLHGDVYRVIDIDVDKQEIKVLDKIWDVENNMKLENWKVLFKGTFNEFIGD